MNNYAPRPELNAYEAFLYVLEAKRRFQPWASVAWTDWRIAHAVYRLGGWAFLGYELNPARLEEKFTQVYAELLADPPEPGHRISHIPGWCEDVKAGADRKIHLIECPYITERDAHRPPGSVSAVRCGMGISSAENAVKAPERVSTGTKRGKK